MSRARDLASNVTALDALADIQAMLTARGVGTVTEDGGIPTGAIVQTGSNANGQFTRFADGTQICQIKRLTLSTVGAGIISGTWTFPSPFVSTTNLTVSATITGETDATAQTSVAANATPAGGEVTAPQRGVLTTTTVAVGIRSIAGMTAFVGGDEMYVSMLAVGRWY